jgi:ATP-binding cassette subfamily F protein uup
MGDLSPLQGEVRHGTNVEMAYFDQLRAQLDEGKSVLDNVGQGRDTITINGRARNLMGYLEDFLFTRDRARAPISALSGGERNRLLLARLFTQPANLLILDEPTNDLDVDTLELLEELLAEYEGTLLLVSHDRAFLDNVVTSTLVFEGDGRFREYAGGYSDWERYQRSIPEATAETVKRSSAPAQPAPTANGPADKPRKLTYKERRELEELPAKIEALENEQVELHARMGKADFYRQPSDRIAATVERLEALKRELEATYERWQTLESIAS